ncbi:MAG: NUDIX domain-containing protein [Acidimicrobiia bacterium]|nr:NUDIX domain-containing protein [Acidimicrobiia bacterium]
MASDQVERRQRISAYAVIVKDGLILLARIAAGYPGSGSWTLPGGGIDWGEHPEAGMHRELYEETGLSGDVISLLGIDSLHLERKRNGKMVGFHAVRIIYHVDADGDPKVTETDGSVSESRWISLEEIVTMPTVELVTKALEMLAAQA